MAASVIATADEDAATDETATVEAAVELATAEVGVAVCATWAVAGVVVATSAFALSEPPTIANVKSADEKTQFLPDFQVRKLVFLLEAESSDELNLFIN
jgi:hypothetical protein